MVSNVTERLGVGGSYLKKATKLNDLGDNGSPVKVGFHDR